MNNDLKQEIKSAIQRFSSGNLTENALHLFQTLGYNTGRQAPLDRQDYIAFRDSYIHPLPCQRCYLTPAGDSQSKFNEEKAMVGDWNYVDLLFQLSEEEMRKQVSSFGIKQVDQTIMESYLFFAIELAKPQYNRTELVHITREVNRLFKMPVMLLFKYGSLLTLSVINRRLHKRDESKDVLEKVTLIKDIRISPAGGGQGVDSPHRAHIEILFDLSFDELLGRHKFTNFVELHDAWQKTLDTKELNEKFYSELFNWYLWASKYVKFPQIRTEEEMTDDKIHQSESLIRLLTRLLFCWFMKEKGLIRENLFDPIQLTHILKGFKGDNADETIYYKAILQNLFFATLSKPVKERKVINNGFNPKEYGDPLVYRYAELFVNESDMLKLFEGIPFLNGGLFECLDQRKDKDNPVEIRLDGFSTKPSKQPVVPDKLFFGEYKGIDLSKEYGNDKKKSNLTVHGLIDILDKYKFTIEENTPIEEEIALDPELLGKVFENLLASYSPETPTTARKQTGSFYTPREIVNYMVDESLKAYLKQNLETEAGMKTEDAEVGLEFLISYNEKEHLFDERQVSVLINAIDTCKILDPACGSGAFPMGVLQKMIHILRKIDPENKQWFEMVIAKFPAYMQNEMRDKLQLENWDYVRKLGIIQECIYGVDIQPIAIQIAKLRFFISLLVDQKEKPGTENRGFEPLPNLDFKLVAAHTLIGLSQQYTPQPMGFSDRYFDQFDKLTEEYFSAYTPKQKEDKKKEIMVLVKSKCDENLQRINNLSTHHDERFNEAMKAKNKEWLQELEYEKKLWQSYLNLFKHKSVGFFETRYFFPKVKEGFDVVIGNPPYIFARESKKKGLSVKEKEYFYEHYELAEYQVNLYPLFIEKGTHLLRENGCLCFITPNNWLTINTNKKMRAFVLGYSDITIVNFYARVFESADVDSAIIIFRKSADNHHLSLYEYANGFQLITSAESSFFLSRQDCVINIEAFKDDRTSGLMQKIEANSDRLLQVADVKAGLVAYEVGKGSPPQTEAMKNKRVYHSDRRVDASYIKYLDGQDVCRYRINWGGQYLKYGDNLAAPRKDFRLYSTRRILVRQIPSQPPYCINACLVEETILNDRNSMNIINIREKPEYVLGILNSRLVSWWFVHKFGKMQRQTFPQFKVNELADFPLPKNRTGQGDEITTLVSRILAITKGSTGIPACEGERTTDKNVCATATNPAAETRELEAEINRLVYALYGLSEEEIAIVEGGIKR